MEEEGSTSKQEEEGVLTAESKSLSISSQYSTLHKILEPSSLQTPKEEEIHPFVSPSEFEEEILEDFNTSNLQIRPLARFWIQGDFPDEVQVRL